VERLAEHPERWPLEVPADRVAERALDAVALFPARVVGARVGDRTVRARQANAAVTSFAQEGLTGLRVLKASGRGAAHAALLRGLADAQADAELPAARLQAALAPIYTLLITAGVLAIVWLGGRRVSAATSVSTTWWRCWACSAG
jgi:ABC-type multidrug transport system fused ATPase/permease subunit